MIDLAVGAKRYDGGTGSAVFTGAIPLRPGQLREADLATVSLWDGAQEIGCTSGALWPRHPDGSLKVVRIAATLTLAAGVQKNLTLRLGTPRTVPGPALPTVDLAWMRKPRLIGSTDAAHLCASRVAPLPLVPIPHPNLPAQWNKFLTTEWDDPATPYPSWGRLKAKVMADDHSVNLGGSANYNFVSAIYYKYLTSGELDRLNEAHHAAQFGSAERLYNGGLPISVYGCCYGSNFNPPGSTNNGKLNGVVFNGDGTPFDANPEGWADLAPGAGPVTGTEWYSGVDTDLLMIYQLSGWEQAKGAFLCRALELFGRRGFPDDPGTIPLANALGSNCGSSLIADNLFKGNYGGRSQWRAWRGADLLYYLLSAPGPMYHHRAAWKASTIPSPRTQTADWKKWFKREHLDFYAAYSDRYVDGHWLKGSWWHTPGWSPPSATLPQGLPFFQLKLLMYDVMLYCMHVEKDPRIEPFIVATAERLRACLRGPEPTVKTPGTGYKLGYAIANAYTNNPTDGPQMAGSGDGFWGTTMLLMIFTAHHRITGAAWSRDLADMHASNTRMALADGGPAGYSTPKEAGELYSDACHAAAFRAGVPIGAWDIDGAIPIPEPTPEPTPEPVPTPTPTPGGIMHTQFNGITQTPPPAVPACGGSSLVHHISVRGLKAGALVRRWDIRGNFTIGVPTPVAPHWIEPDEGHCRLLPVLGEGGTAELYWNFWTAGMPTPPPASPFTVRVDYADGTFEEAATAPFPVPEPEPIPEPAPSPELVARVTLLEAQMLAAIEVDKDLVARIGQLEGLVGSVVTAHGDLAQRISALEEARGRVKAAL